MSEDNWLNASALWGGIQAIWMFLLSQSILDIELDVVQVTEKN